MLSKTDNTEVLQPATKTRSSKYKCLNEHAAFCAR